MRQGALHLEENYGVYFGNRPVGKVQVTRQGLYYHFLCRCELTGDVMCRLWVTCADKRESLGLVVPVDEEADRESCRQQAASLFSQINASTDPAAAFAALEETYGTGEGGRTFLPGRGILPAAVEEAAETLEEDQWSGILEADDGFYLLLRRPLDTGAVAADYFDSRLQQAAQEADITTTSTFDALEVPAFYERLTAARDRAEEDGET